MKLMNENENSTKITRLLNQSSIEVSKNSRGWTYSVKAYGSSPEAIKVELSKLSIIAEALISSKGVEAQ